MNQNTTLFLSRCEVAALLTVKECIAAVEHAFRLYGEKRAAPPEMLGLHGERWRIPYQGGLPATWGAATSLRR